MKKVGAVQLKHKRVLKEMVENGGNMGDAIRKAGYSESVASTPSKLTNTKSWKATLEEYFPDELVAQKHRELLDAKKVECVIKGGKIVAERVSTDYQALAKALDMLNKLKGNYKNTAEVEQKSLSLAELLGKGALDQSQMS